MSLDLTSPFERSLPHLHAPSTLMSINSPPSSTRTFILEAKTSSPQMLTGPLRVVDPLGNMFGHVRVLEKSAATGMLTDVPAHPVHNDTSVPPVNLQHTAEEISHAQKDQNWLELSTKSIGYEPEPSVRPSLYISSFFHNSLSYGLVDFLPDEIHDTSNLTSFLPRYLRGFGWKPNSPCSSITVLQTFIDSPLPRPPSSEFNNASALSTIQNYPHLFHVSTPINIACFEYFCQDHPKPDFVSSVVTAL